MAKVTKVKVGLLMLIGGTSNASEDLNTFDESVHIYCGGHYWKGKRNHSEESYNSQRVQFFSSLCWIRPTS